MVTNLIGLESCLVPRSGLVLRIEADDYALLFDPDSGRVQVLNETAVDIWQRLDGRKSLADILSELRRDYDGVDADAGDQLLSMAQTLLEIDAVELREPV